MAPFAPDSICSIGDVDQRYQALLMCHDNIKQQQQLLFTQTPAVRAVMFLQVPVNSTRLEH